MFEPSTTVKPEKSLKKRAQKKDPGVTVGSGQGEEEEEKAMKFA